MSHDVWENHRHGVKTNRMSANERYPRCDVSTVEKNVPVRCFAIASLPLLFFLNLKSLLKITRKDREITRFSNVCIQARKRIIIIITMFEDWGRRATDRTSNVYENNRNIY